MGSVAFWLKNHARMPWIWEELDFSHAPLGFFVCGVCLLLLQVRLCVLLHCVWFFRLCMRVLCLLPSLTGLWRRRDAALVYRNSPLAGKMEAEHLS